MSKLIIFNEEVMINRNPGQPFVSLQFRHLIYCYSGIVVEARKLLPPVSLSLLRSSLQLASAIRTISSLKSPFS